MYRLPFDWTEEWTTGSADLVLVNSAYTRGVFAQTFQSLAARGIQPAVLYPAVRSPHCSKRPPPPSPDCAVFLSINRFERKKNIALAVRAFAALRNVYPAVFQRAVARSSSLRADTMFVLPKTWST